MNRWFVVPRAGTGDQSDPYRPEFHDAGVDSFSGMWHDFSDDVYSDLPWYPDPMYVVRVYGTDSALDALASYDDCYGKQEHDLSDSEVADYLNDARGETFSFTEWTDRLLASR